MKARMATGCKKRVSKGKSGSRTVSRAEMPCEAVHALHCSCKKPLQFSKPGVLLQFCPLLVHGTNLCHKTVICLERTY